MKIYCNFPILKCELEFSKYDENSINSSSGFWEKCTGNYKNLVFDINVKVLERDF